MKKKDLLYVALGLTVGAGVYYMGKSKVVKNLLSNGNIGIDNNGNTSITDKGKNNSSNTNPKNNQTKLFDYNNPSVHSPTGYWKSGTTGIFYLPLVDNDGNIFDYAEIKIENDGKIEPTIITSLKAGINSLMFWK